MVRLHFLAVFACVPLISSSQEATASLPSRTKHPRAFTNGTGLGPLPNERGGGGGGGGGHGSAGGGGGGGHSSSSGDSSGSGGHGSSSGSSSGGAHGGCSCAATLSAPKWLVTAGILIALIEYVPLPILFPFAASYVNAQITSHPDEAIIPREVTQPVSPVSNITRIIPATDKKGRGGGGGCLTCSGAATLSAHRWLAKAGLLVAVSRYITLPLLLPLFAGYAKAESITTGDAAPFPTVMAQKCTLVDRQLIG